MPSGSETRQCLCDNQHYKSTASSLTSNVPNNQHHTTTGGLQTSLVEKACNKNQLQIATIKTIKQLTVHKSTQS